MVVLKRLKKFSLLFLVSVVVVLVYFNICIVSIHAEVLDTEEQGWIQNPANGHYYLLTEPLSWLEAEAQAVEWGGHLVTINNREEELWLTERFGTYEYFWIGFNDIKSEGNWEWVSGEPVAYTNWVERQPDNHIGIEDSAIINWANSDQINDDKAKDFGDGWNDILIDGISRGIVEKTITELPKGKVVFISDRDGNNEIYIMNTDGTGQTRLTYNSADDFFPALSPDGNKIAYNSDRDGNGEIYIMNTDGTGQTRLTDNLALDYHPCFSPDGSKIVFSSQREGIDDIFIMSLDGTGLVNLTNNFESDCWQPSISPDGKKIVFETRRDENREIYIMNVDGSEQTNLTNNPAEDWWPSFSSDGSKIIFQSDRDGNYEIYIMNVDGSEQTRITNNPASEQWPCIYFSESKVNVADENLRSERRFAPEITRFILTLRDVFRTKRPVIYTNVLLAIITMVPFAVASELFNIILSENEEDLKRKIRKIRPVAYLRRLNEKIKKRTGAKMGRHLIARNIAQMFCVILFYGLAYSLLDPTWKPFSKPFNIKVLTLLLDMAIVYGIVGIAGDIMKWRVLKKWKVPAEFSVQPKNLLVSVISISASRLLALVPGMMFGAPAALQVDKSTLDIAKRDRLSKISFITLLLIGSVLWSLTLATETLQKYYGSGTLYDVIGGIEGFLLIGFAVALQNTFIQMLGFPGGFGQTMRQRNRWVWFVGLVAIAFVFYLTLINPRYELVEALQETGVIVFLSIAFAFIVVIFGLWLHFYFRKKRRLP